MAPGSPDGAARRPVPEDVVVMGGPAVDGLRERVRGAVITPDDEGYEQARRVYNGTVDRHGRRSSGWPTPGT